MERLATKRSVTRAELQRLSEELQALTTEILQPEHEERLAEMAEEVEALAREIKQQDALIEPHVADTDLANEYRGVQQNQSLITRMRTRLGRMRERTSSSSGSSGSSVVEPDTASNGRTVQRAGQLKLPKLELQRFSGDRLEWQSFWEQFRQAIHENTSLTSVEKFLYLRNVLTGKAARVVSGIQATEDNYSYVVDLLKKRFGREDVLVQEHLTQLLNLPPVKVLNDVVALRSLHDHVQKNIAALKTLGVKSDSYGAMLCAALFRVLPADWAVEYHKRRDADNGVTDHSALDDILSSLRLELESREKVYKDSGPGQPPPTRNHGAREQQGEYSKRKGSAASLKVGAKPFSEKCPLCFSKSHNAPQCDAAISIEEKKQRLRSDGRCFRCAKRGHMTRECKNWFLRCEKCGRRHLTQLCDPPASSGASEKEPAERQAAASLHSGSNNSVLLQTAQVWVDGRERKRLARCLLDGGSQRSFVTKNLSRELNLEVIGEEDVTIYPFGGASNVTKGKRRLVRLWLKSQHSRKEHSVEALEIEDICADQLVLPDSAVETAELAGLELADVTVSPARRTTEDIEILIGADHYWSIVSGEVRKLDRTLVAVNTDFGWTLQGPIAQPASVVSCSTVAVLRAGVAERTFSLSEELRAFWELESLGIATRDCPAGSEDKKVREDFTSSLAFVDGRYEAGLPWKPLDRQLESNEAVARQRLIKLMRSLSTNKERLAQYDQTIRDYLDKGYAERVPESEVDASSKAIYYMPHRAVFRPDSSTTKIRIVFDASAKAQGCLSLNDALSTGPSLNPDLLQLILNFRRHAIAVTADIEKAFLQIEIKPDDRDALRFLWYACAPTASDLTGAEMEVWRMTRVPFGATSSPFMLAATIKHHLSKVPEELSDTAKVLDGCLYVDDLIAGVETVERAVSFYEEAQRILGSAGMKLRKWSSNCHLLQRRFATDGVGNPSSETETPTSPVTRVLGLEWDRESDELKYSLGTTLELLTVNRNTKRFVLQASARIFDPLGLLGPATITAKILFQELWTLGLDWDTPLPAAVSAKWSKWVSALHHLEDISIPRRYASGAGDTELHIFTDASPKACGAAAYLRSERDGETTVTLVMAKTRVAPLKSLSLPRLELLGALLGARMCDYLKGALGFNYSRLTLWTDSMIALHWIKGSAAQWKPFVANRVMEIQEKTEPSDWRHCPGNENPADMLTRGVAPDGLKDCDRWWQGPTWLAQSPTDWPTTPTGPPSRVPDEERKSSALAVGHLGTDTPQRLVPVEQFSDLNRLLRVTAWVRRFVSNCRRNSERTQDPPSAEEIREARLTLLRQVQREAFGNDGASADLRTLNVFRDTDGLLRLKGRLQQSDLSYETAHPIVLPATHHFVELLIDNTHRRLLHAGCLDVLTELRETYWIIHARQAVKKVLSRCIVCKRIHGKKATEPVAPLPRDRVSEAAPFTVTGLDFAGPVMTKSEGNTKKSYILLLTCAVTRAVHLEVVSDMSTRSFLLAFRRFVARRGLCRTIYSDNAKTFHRASVDLTTLLKTARKHDVLDYLSKQNIEWKFIAERAAWWGGFWERMVRSVKTALKKVLGCSYVTFEELSTILTDIEAVINSRPLTCITSDANEPEPLTPAHFLVGRRLTSLPTRGGGVPAAASANELSRRWRYRERVSTLLWRRWRKEYLCTLRSYHNAAPTASSNLKVDNLVLLHDDFHPRQTWKTGRIVKVFPGRDGHSRSCLLRLPGGTTIRRPVQLLHPLEA